MRIVTVRGLIALWALGVLALSGEASAFASLDARKCGKPGSRCEVLAQNLETPRSISRIQADGTFFVGTAGNAQEDLIGELISDRDTDTSVVGGAVNRSGQDVLLADLGQAELRLRNPDGVLYPVADGFGHHAGEPVYAMNPYGLLPRGSSIWVADAAANDLFRIDRENGALDLVTVFPNRLQTQEAVPIKVFQGPGDRL